MNKNIEEYSFITTNDLETRKILLKLGLTEFSVNRQQNHEDFYFVNEPKKLEKAEFEKMKLHFTSMLTF
jgi:hypothetical protein